jgi:molybdenum cofactor cytidylyltransferase
VIAAVVLAAGRSQRMGENKLLLEHRGEPLVRHAVRALLSSRARPIVVVTGHEGERVAAALAGEPVALVHNPDYADGLSTSLRAGIAALPPEVEGALICLGDMPLVLSRHVDALIAAFDPVGAPICAPVDARGRRGHPVLWARRYFAEMDRLSGDQGARGLLDRYPVRAVPTGDLGVTTDVDTKEDLACLH